MKSIINPVFTRNRKHPLIKMPCGSLWCVEFLSATINELILLNYNWVCGYLWLKGIEKMKGGKIVPEK
jgi:hypothetical protein